MQRRILSCKKEQDENISLISRVYGWIDAIGLDWIESRKRTPGCVEKDDGPKKKTRKKEKVRCVTRETWG